ncbi:MULTISPECIES: LysR family transcriptional regulator [Pigmentiphaga]|uniref:LysR family transcriptional regulator n=1 Tax=Pigmentiphaga daeguensis TaxID=414049 RepID=A0ABP3MNC1_9BURK|nr:MULTISPECIES: LysR family transcriptional regulator [unclassified Pigmentiphaga]OVZ59240.1 hypothetical protein CDO46_24110 [Pigmentiphaga sp. NML030171]
MLNSKLLTCFLAVVTHRTLTAAADELCITQPALSKSLRKLEEQLGVPLFKRTAAGMVPTAYGATLAHRARLIQLESQRAHDEILSMKDGGVGMLNVGAGPLWSVHLLPDVVAELAQTHPSLRVRVVPGVLSTLLPQLLRGELDIICAALDFPDHDDIEKEYLIDSSHVFLAHRSHPLHQADEVSDVELSRCRFVGPHNDYAVLERMKRYFALRGLDTPGFAAEADSLEILLSLVATGQFVATQSHQVLPHARKLGIDVLPTAQGIWRFRGGLARRRHPVALPLIDLFGDCMRRHVAARESSGGL